MIARDRLKEFEEYKKDSLALDDGSTRREEADQPGEATHENQDAGAQNPTLGNGLSQGEDTMQQGEWEAKEQQEEPEAEKPPESPISESAADAVPKEDAVDEEITPQESLEDKLKGKKEAMEEQKKENAAMRRLAMRCLLQGIQDHHAKFRASSGEKVLLSFPTGGLTICCRTLLCSASSYVHFCLGIEVNVVAAHTAHSLPLFHKKVETKPMIEQRVADEVLALWPELCTCHLPKGPS